MTKTTHPVIPREQHETRNPEAEKWIPASAGLTDRDTLSVYVSTLSALRYEHSQ